ncbi:MAG: MTH1187 family thiamine-binding protein [Thermoanaerobacteraceae bacterium]|nr:MTH1187 family thiamine-binding protein [Thermoanaerobacteraceae bacterium]
MAVVEVTVIPIGTGSASLSAHVARCVQVLHDAREVKYQLTPMGTIIEGELDRILPLVRRMHEVPFEQGTGRVVTTIRIDDRRDKTLTMAGKVSAVEEKLKK